MPVIRYYLFGLLAAVVLVISIAGFQGSKSTITPVEIFNDMDHQPKYKEQSPSVFYSDGRSSRLPVSGTVNHDTPEGNSYLGTGRFGNNWGDGIPVPVTPALLARGQERFTINCAVCHGASGNGKGITTQYGLNGVANLITEKYLTMPDGQIFNTITHGFGQMGSYAHIKPEDRWAIIAYIRALQISQTSKAQDLPENLRASLK